MLLVRRLLSLYARFYGNEFTVKCPTGSGVRMTLFQVAQEIARRLTRIFLRDEQGPFHGDSGADLGASRQTGWSGLVANLIQGLGGLDGEGVLEDMVRAALVYPQEPSGAKA